MFNSSSWICRCACPLLLYHLAHTFPPFLVGDADEIDACRQFGDVDLQGFALALHRGHALTEGVEDFDGFQVLARDSKSTAGGIRVKGGESCGLIFLKACVQTGLSPMERIVWNGAETSTTYF